MHHLIILDYKHKKNDLLFVKKKTEKKTHLNNKVVEFGLISDGNGVTCSFSCRIFDGVGSVFYNYYGFLKKLTNVYKKTTHFL